MYPLAVAKLLDFQEPGDLGSITPAVCPADLAKKLLFGFCWLSKYGHVCPLLAVRVAITAPRGVRWDVV